ncbi:uncharacterized protein CCOS01_05735 [Colletotrichum costaricense]|uniref:Uncharacterized protein n=1 Tax=Colletotrichum costaricense TaxID=1209916 RepID=A0AAI9Z287_9PEZI|nr:uncharacterized protein CCOS01_05735 [Colletotrichum costaricense]KAK1530632.1 hypothetical protein CCOS01_05735 [Colletotrichum costaricense]
MGDSAKEIQPDFLREIVANYSVRVRSTKTRGASHSWSLKPSRPPTAKAAPTKTYSLRPCHSCTRGGRPVAWYSRLETTLP